MQQSFYTVAVAPFGLFKKKDDAPQPREQPTVDMPAAGTLSIREAQELLQKIESARVHELASRLEPVRGSVARSLKTIDELASHMEHEKVKLEDMENRFKSIVENSRRTIVASLRREAATELPLPQSANDAKKFKERFEAMMNRIGEVSGSHSKVLNVFMKKNAAKMKEEFEVLTELLTETRSVMSEFDQKRAPIVKCGNILNTASQKASSIGSDEAAAKGMEKEIAGIEGELERLKGELASVSASPEFAQALGVASKIAEAEAQEAQFRSQVLGLFSHVSRAFTKYSYGVSKETEARFQLMSDEPWKLLHESDISPYSTLLSEVRKSIESGKVQLKDSDRMLNYLDEILKSLHELQGRARSLRSEVETLRRIDISIVQRAKEIEERAAALEEELARDRQLFEQQKRQAAEKADETDALLREAIEMLADLTGKRYALGY